MSHGPDSLTTQPSAEDVIRWLGLDDRKLEAAARFTEQVAERMQSLSTAFIPFLERVLASLSFLSEASETPGHERLFVEGLGHHPLVARMITRQAHRLGQLLAEEINAGRRVRGIIDEIAKTSDCSALVISRRARKLRDECVSEPAQIVIDIARKADLRIPATEFTQLVEAACARDEAACRELGRIAQRLAPCLPEKRGRPISVETCTHACFLGLLDSFGFHGTCTYSSLEGNFVDSATRATRLAVKNPRFSPLHAMQLCKTLL